MAGSTRSKSDGSGFQGQGAKGDYSSRARDSYNTTISRNQALNKANTSTVPKNNKGTEQWKAPPMASGPRIKRPMPSAPRVKPLEIDVPGYPAKKKVAPKKAAPKAKAPPSRTDGSGTQRGYGYGQGSKAGGGVGRVTSGGKTTTGGYSSATGGAFSGSGAPRGGFGQK